MPGHIVHAACPCGFERELYPGATNEGGRVMAYTNGGADLQTVDDTSAAKQKLATLDDPYLLDPSELEALTAEYGELAESGDDADA